MTNGRYIFKISIQGMGFILVSICLFSGLISGDYNKTQLYQFVAGIVMFYSGRLIN
jgi:hypothetical protein